LDNTSDLNKPLSQATQDYVTQQVENVTQQVENVTQQVENVAQQVENVSQQVENVVIADASTSEKGKIQLAGDLGGTADAPTVPDLALKANIDSPTFTGAPLAPTATAGTSTTQIATTAFVAAAISTGGSGGSSSANLTGMVTSVGNATTVVTNANLTGDVSSSGSNATTIGVGKVTNAMLLGSIDLTAKVTGILPVANGGTGSLTQNFVDLTANQSIAGNKTFIGTVAAATLTVGTVTYPNAHNSTAGQVLTVGATGTATWGSAAPSVREEANQFTATVSQTAFTLTQTASVNSKVKMYINGIRISNSAYTLSDTTVTYVAANNGAYTLTAGDRIQFDYFY